MTSRPWLSVALLCFSAAPLLSQQAGTPNTVQPGAPGQDTKVLSSAGAAAATTPRPPSDADVAFMQGMIHHHNQAVEMTALIESHTQNPEVRNIGNRINISQTDEMRFMRQWLTDRGFAVPASHDMMNMAGMGSMDHSQTAGMGSMDHSQMAGMDHSQMDHSKMNHDDMAGMGAMPAMPGMLTPAQMAALRAAKGAEFDHLFLSGMIQHHTGALTMVKDLLAHPGAAQDPVLFDFASDVDNTQLAEIDFMKAMLAKEKQ